MESFVLNPRSANQDLIANLTAVSNPTPRNVTFNQPTWNFLVSIGRKSSNRPFSFPRGSWPKTMHSLLIIAFFFSSPYLPLKIYIFCSSVTELSSLLLLRGMLPDSWLFNKYTLITKIYSVEFLLFNIWL